MHPLSTSVEEVRDSSGHVSNLLERGEEAEAGKMTTPSTKLAIVINLQQLEDYMEEFVNSNDASRDQWHSPDALKHRLFMGQFLIWLRNKLKEQSNVETQTTPSITSTGTNRSTNR